MRGFSVTPLVVLMLVVVLAMPASAAAKSWLITGTLSESGYTVIALADGGKASVVASKSGKFKLRSPSKRVTLHLRASDGRYGGPIVLGSRDRGRRAFVGLEGAAKLGAITVNARRGYAKVKRPPRLAIDRDRLARAKRGVPIGASRFGRVRSQKPHLPPEGGLDFDGIPDLLDVDDDGDLILDKFDRSALSKSAHVADGSEQFDLHSRLTLYLDNTANANAAGLTAVQMDDELSMNSDLLLTMLPGDSSPNSPELDCGGSIQQPPRPEGLIYCRPHSAGGVGSVFAPAVNVPDLPAFPDCCDPDGDGLGTMSGTPGVALANTSMTLRHRAKTSQIGTGDLMIQRVLRGGVEVSFLAGLHYVFASVPALVSYDEDGVGGKAPQEITYPGVAAGIGTRNNGFPVKARANGDVMLTLTFWRPQRKAVAEWGELGDWIDIGRLRYGVAVEESGKVCPQAAFSEPDANLALHSSSPPYGGLQPGFTDLHGDQSAARDNTFTFTLNLTECLRANGFPLDGADRGFNLLAINPSGVDNAQQGVWFKHQE